MSGSTLASVERGFADAVARQLRGGVLTHNDRHGLLRAAERLHLERFRANLIIALVQREMGHSSLPPEPRPAKATRRPVAPPSTTLRAGYRRTVELAALAVAGELVAAVSMYLLHAH